MPRISQEKAPNLPQKIYKYQGVTKNALENLMNDQIWFSTPSSFNDPFDCNIALSSHATKTDVRRLYDHYKGRPELHPELENYIGSDGELTDEWMHKLHRAYRGAAEDQIQHVRNETGVSCFSSKADEILMWSYYAEGHRGFVLEFDTSLDPFDSAREVKYEDQIPTVNFVNALLNGVDPLFWGMITTKFRNWEHEAEWRLFHKNGNQLYKYQPESLSGIYLGYAMSEKDIIEISKIMSNKPGIIYKMDRSTTHFDVFPKKITP